MTIAILCSGQGRQHANMFALTENAPEAASVFAHTVRLLGDDPRSVARTETDDNLHQNRVGQILCTLQALAAHAALLEALPDRIVVAGYSIGEVAAWSIGGLLEANATIELAAHRAEVMNAASPPGDGLTFIRGLSKKIIDDLCRRHDVAVAIVNPGDAFILGGSRAALRALSVEARRRNVKRIVDLPVNVASHTRRLAAASPCFRERLTSLKVATPSPTSKRLLSGIDGSPVFDVETGLNKLAAQISQTVQWSQCLQSCIESGATAFLELGPGRALTDMVSETYKGVSTRSLDDFKSIQGAREWLAGLASR